MTELIIHKGIMLYVSYEIGLADELLIHEVIYNGTDVTEIYDNNNLLSSVEEILQIKLH